MSWTIPGTPPSGLNHTITTIAEIRFLCIFVYPYMEFRGRSSQPDHPSCSSLRALTYEARPSDHMENGNAELRQIISCAEKSIYAF